MLYISSQGNALREKFKEQHLEYDIGLLRKQSLVNSLLLLLCFFCQIGLIERVDKIYRSTNFGKGYESGMGFEIKEVTIISCYFCINTRQVC